MSDQPAAPGTSPTTYLAEHWRVVRLNALEWNAPPVQVLEMRRAFYMGAAAMFAELMGIADDSDPDAEPTPAELQKTSDLYAELRAFNDQVGEGLA